MRDLVDEHGNEVKLTNERLRHILRRHPDMAFHMHRFEETLTSPDAVRLPKFDPQVRLYYRLYSDLQGRNR